MIDSHPIPYELILDYAEGRLSAHESELLGARIAARPAAAAQLAAISELLALMRDDQSEDAPEHVVQRAVRLMRQRQPSFASARPMRRLVASLRLDSWRTSLATGLRSERVLPRNMVYSVDEYTLDLQAGVFGARWQLRGQVLGPEEDGLVELSGAGGTVAAVVNTLGEFTLPPVLPGRYDLILRQARQVIVIEALELGQP